VELEKSNLTRQELLDLLELTQDALAVNTEHELKNLLLRVKKLVPCEHMLSLLGQTDHEGQLLGVTKLVNINYSADWLTHYAANGYAAVDPILIHHFHSFKTQTWSQTYQSAASSAERQFAEHAQSYGLSQGITLGQRSRRNGTGSMFSFAGQDMGEHPRHLGLLTRLAPHLHVAMMRAAYAAAELPALTTRELDVLQWIAQGKTDWEISRIFRISERTVTFHVQNVMVKLHAASRSQAIALAMQQGLVGASSSTLETWLASLGTPAGISPNRVPPLSIPHQPEAVT